MSQLRIFVSHSSADSAFCDLLVGALRAAGADVWYDQHNLGAGELLNTIPEELKTRPVFIVVLSKPAFESTWVRNECQWAFNLAERESGRVLLPVVAQPIKPSDFDAMLFLEGFKRIEGPGNRPYPVAEAIAQSLRHLGLAPNSLARLDDVDSLIAQGKVLKAEKRFQGAVPLFERALKQSPDSFEAWDEVGDAYYRLERWREALHAFERMASIRPDSTRAWSNMCAALTSLQRYNEAWSACEQALALDPNNANVWINKAGVLFMMGRINEALDAIDQSIAINPQNAEAWTNKGDILTHLKRPHEALVAYDQATVVDPRHDRAWGEKAAALVGLRNMAAALDAADRAIALDSHVGLYWLMRGAALTNQYRLHEALDALDRALALGLSRPEFKSRAVSLRAKVAGLIKTAQHKMPGH